MKRVYSMAERSFSDIRFVGIAIKAIDDSQRHIGILHRGSDADNVMMLHLAWHHDLRNNAPTQKFIWIDPPIPEVRAKQVAAFCRLVWRQNDKRIPFAFTPPSNCFDTESGQFMANEKIIGLTCATFVLSVFQATGLPMIQASTWPHRPEDVEWQDLVLDRLKSTGADAAHISRVRENRDNIRFRPEEVAGASAHSPWRVEFLDACRNADGILERLRGLPE